MTKEQLIQNIQDVIKTNGNNEITGALLQITLIYIVEFIDQSEEIDDALQAALTSLNNALNSALEDIGVKQDEVEQLIANATNIMQSANKALINVSQYNNKYDYADVTAARNAVPVSLRALGQLVCYKLLSGVWGFDKYIGTNVSGWATLTNWAIVGEVSKADLALKADKKLSDNTPVTYYKSGDDSGQIDLTADLRATLGAVLWNQENNWFVGSATDNINTYYRLADSTLENQINKRAAVKLQLQANTWYEVGGLNNPMAKYTFDPTPWQNERNTVQILSGNTTMPQNNPPSAILGTLRATDTTSNGGYGAIQEMIFARYGESFKFKTPNSPVWLIILVRCDDTVACKRLAADTENYYFFPEWAFDSTQTITLHKLSGDSESSVDRLIDNESNLLKELDFESVIDEKLNDIDGIVSGAVTVDNPELIVHDNISFIPGFQINSDGTVFNTGNGQYGYFDFIPVKGGKNYRVPRGFTFNQNTSQASIYFYNSSKAFVKNNQTPTQNASRAGCFFAPEDGFLRINMNSNSWANPNTNNKNMYKGVSLGWADQIIEEPHVSISSDQLSDAEPITESGVNGIILPKLFIREENIISGSIDNTFNINMRNLSTFVGSFNTAIDRIFALQPRARHVFVGHFSYDGANGNGWLRPMIETQRAMCENRNIPYIDLASIMGWTHNDHNIVEGVDYNNQRSFMSDYTHPGVDSTQVTANLLTDRLTILLRDYVKSGEIVANIGDSVSAGYTGTPIGVAAWARYIERALIAIGCTVKLYASSGGALRATTTDGGPVNNGFMGNTDPSWGFTKDVINNIGTSNQPNVYLWEIGHNDFTADDRDFKLSWF